MAYKLPALPTPKADIHELADCLEILILKQQIASKLEFLGYLGDVIDNDIEDRERDEVEIEERTAAVWAEIYRRIRNCGLGRYPFKVSEDGNIVELDPQISSENLELYLFLLLSTRLNMKKQHVQAGIDGTKLFERVSEIVAKNYLGDRAFSIVFGTGSEDIADFRGRVNNLCCRLGEGGGFQDRPGVDASSKNDDKLDVVAWKNFSDRRNGKLILWGQCKTGTNWEMHLTATRPSDFAAKWFRDCFAVEPVRIFLLTEAIGKEKWYEYSRMGGIVFDRSRIMDYSDNLPSSIKSDVKTWSEEARRTHINN
ncbi:MAG: hypothetical protein BWZ03_00337 [bacterium ADurb.BinA186]|nr:MAG: hypothetical protein BWZ03_00337 [bacterium ADurb.BinA186]